MSITRSSTLPLRRPPLAPIHLPSDFASTSYLAPPSPLSMSNKRCAPGSPGSRGEGSRKVSRTESRDSARSGRRGSSEITPKVKERLERDDLGVGRSPARRLFMGGSGGSVEAGLGIRSGISGMITTPSSPRPHSQPQSQSQTLAPSPPLSPRTRSSQAMTEDENGATRSIHDPGFPIHPDTLGSGIGSPDSRRHTTTLLSSPPTISSTSSTSTSKYEDQENIPPPPRSRSHSTHTTPSSSKSTPSKRSVLDSGSSKASSEYEEENTIIPEPASLIEGSGGRGRGIIGIGRRGKSKLIQVMLRGVSNPVEKEEGDTEPESESGDEEDGDGEELTSGKRVDLRGKEKLAKELS